MWTRQGFYLSRGDAGGLLGCFGTAQCSRVDISVGGVTLQSRHNTTRVEGIAWRRRRLAALRGVFSAWRHGEWRQKATAIPRLGLSSSTRTLGLGPPITALPEAIHGCRYVTQNSVPVSSTPRRSTTVSYRLSSRPPCCLGLKSCGVLGLLEDASNDALTGWGDAVTGLSTDGARARCIWSRDMIR